MKMNCPICNKTCIRFNIDTLLYEQVFDCLDCKVSMSTNIYNEITYIAANINQFKLIANLEEKMYHVGTELNEEIIYSKPVKDLEEAIFIINKLRTFS